MQASMQDVEPSEEALRVLHKTIDAVGQMTEDLRFNTAISQMMVFVNELTGMDVKPRSVLEQFIKLLAPYAPHMAEEIWARLGHKETIAYVDWPVADEKYLAEDLISLAVQVNGKLRDQLEVPADITEDAIREMIDHRPKLEAHLEGKTIVKMIYVPGRLVSLVVK